MPRTEYKADREKEILAFRAQGVTIEIIAEKLDVSVSVINAVIRRVKRQEQHAQLQAFLPAHDVCSTHLKVGCPQCMS
jgi:DNA-binding NarL/FixJ family response regulator